MDFINNLFPYEALFKNIGDTLTAWWVLTTLAYLICSIIYLSFKSQKIIKSLQEASNNFSEEKIENDEVLNEEWEHYKQTFIDINGTKKTSEEADNFFHPEIILLHRLNTRYWNSVPNIMVGFGILGTFVGLTFGVAEFNTDTSETIKLSIKILLSGMATAFVSSIWGMLTSMVFTVFEKWQFSRIARYSGSFCKLLNRQFLLNKTDELNFLKEEQQRLLKQYFQEQNQVLKQFFTFESSEQKDIYPGQAFKELVNHAEQQTKTFKQFSTDLSDGINISDQTLTTFKDFQEELLKKFFVFVNESNNEIYPAHLLKELRQDSAQQTKALKSFSSDLADGIKISTETISAFGDQMIEIIEKPFKKELSPALDKLEVAVQKLRETKEESSGSVIEKIVSELQVSLHEMGEQLHQSLSGSAVSQLEHLAGIISESGNALNSLPQQINHMINAMEEQVSKTKVMLEESLNVSKQASENQLQETQKMFETLMKELKDGVAHQQQVIQYISSKMGENAQVATKAMSEHVLNSTKQVEETIKALQDNMKDVISSQQETGLSMQELVYNAKDMIERTYNLSEHMEKSLTKVNDTFTIFENITDNLTDTSRALEASGSNLNEVTVKFGSQADNFLSANQRSMQQLESSLKYAQNLASEYSGKFKVIEDGLSGVFGEIQTGLTRYQETTRTSLDRYLGDFTDKLANASKHLSGSIDALNEVVESVVDTSEKLNNRR